MTDRIKELLTEYFHEGKGEISLWQDWYSAKLTPKDRIAFVNLLLEYFEPKRTRTDYTNNPNELKDFLADLADKTKVKDDSNGSI